MVHDGTSKDRMERDGTRWHTMAQVSVGLNGMALDGTRVLVVV